MVLAEAAPHTFNRVDNRTSIRLGDGHSPARTEVQATPTFLSLKSAASVRVDPGGSHRQIDNMAHGSQSAGRAGFYAVKLRTQETRFSVWTEDRRSPGGAILLRSGEKSLLRTCFYTLVTMVAKIGELPLRNRSGWTQQPPSWRKGALPGDTSPRVDLMGRPHESAKGSAYKPRSFNKKTSAIYPLAVSHFHILHYDRSEKLENRHFKVATRET